MTTWDDTLICEAQIGFRSNLHHLKIYAPTAEAVAFTGQITALSLDNGCGVKFTLGPRWVARMHERAREIERMAEDL